MENKGKNLGQELSQEDLEKASGGDGPHVTYPVTPQVIALENAMKESIRRAKAAGTTLDQYLAQIPKNNVSQILFIKHYWMIL